MSRARRRPTAGAAMALLPVLVVLGLLVTSLGGSQLPRAGRADDSPRLAANGLTRGTESLTARRSESARPAHDACKRRAGKAPALPESDHLVLAPRSARAFEAARCPAAPRTEATPETPRARDAYAPRGPPATRSA